MNIFKQYGIKEVADVTFYSITRIGNEEFYIPVLYFDSLKVSTLDKSVEAVNHFGGKGNGKIISWNFGKDLKLKLEDALFSQMSLNTFMNGRVMAKLSDWTSAIAKLNVANKYGQKNYSVKAYPSPELTAAEWEIIFRCAQKAGFDPRYGSTEMIGYRQGRDIPAHDCKYIYDSEGQDEAIDAIVAENRWKLVDQYYRRTQPTPRSRDLSPYFDFNEHKYESICVTLKDYEYLDIELRNAREVNAMNIGDRWGGWRDMVVSYREKEQPYKLNVLNSQYHSIVVKLHYSIERRADGWHCVWAYISADNIGQSDGEISTIDKLQDLFTGYNKDKSSIGNGVGGDFNATFHIGNEFFLEHILYYIFPHYLEDAIGNLCWCDLREITHKAMPQKVIDCIAEEIDTFSKTGRFENDLYEAQHIDRMEKCVVLDRKGLKIDLIEQMRNVKKMYNNTMETFTVFMDAKTMLPFMDEKILDEKILAQKCVRIYKGKNGILTSKDYLPAIKNYLRNQYDNDWVNSLTDDDYVVNKVTDQYGYTHQISGKYEILNTIDNKTVEYMSEDGFFLVYFNIIKRDYITLKYGTIYYKWSRTIDEDNTELTFIGTDLSIDVDTFPGEFMIVGETLIREQQTGKDQRYQIVLPRTAISASTSLKLQAAGEPTTFSINVDVLVPIDKTKSMLELRAYNVAEDKAEGGYRIIPQNKKHSYTSPMEIKEEIVIPNNEIY